MARTLLAMALMFAAITRRYDPCWNGEGAVGIRNEGKSDLTEFRLRQAISKCLPEAAGQLYFMLSTQTGQNISHPFLPSLGCRIRRHSNSL